MIIGLVAIREIVEGKSCCLTGTPFFVPNHRNGDDPPAAIRTLPRAPYFGHLCLLIMRSSLIAAYQQSLSSRFRSAIVHEKLAVMNHKRNSAEVPAEPVLVGHYADDSSFLGGPDRFYLG